MQSVTQKHAATVSGERERQREKEGGVEGKGKKVINYSHYIKSFRNFFIGLDICYNIVIMCNQMGAVVAKLGNTS